MNVAIAIAIYSVGLLVCAVLLTRSAPPKDGELADVVLNVLCSLVWPLLALAWAVRNLARGAR